MPTISSTSENPQCRRGADSVRKEMYLFFMVLKVLLK